MRKIAHDDAGQISGDSFQAASQSAWTVDSLEYCTAAKIVT